MKRPVKAFYDFGRDISDLQFSHDDFGQYYMRGGVAWPELDDGFIVLCGQNVNTKKIYVFEQRPFLVVENVFNDDRSREFEGLGQWFNGCWSKYLGKKFFGDESKELIQKGFALQIYRSATIDPKPILIKLSLSDGGKSLVYEVLRLRRLVVEEGTDLHNALETLKTDPKAELPALHALACCLAGYAKFPLRR